jgi:hypothetical protein
MMTELERFELCRYLPRLSCGLYFHIAQDVTQACLTDAQFLLSAPNELREQYDATQRRYAALPPKARTIADTLLPWMLQLRLQYGAECTDMLVRLYPRMSVRAKLNGLLKQPN